MKMKYAIALLTIVGVAGTASAATIAHWGLDEGAATITNSPFYMDQSGNGNHLATWADFTAPAGSTDRPFTTVPQTGVANPASLDFTGGNKDLYTQGGAMIDSYSFDAGWTVETSFKVGLPNQWGIIVGKDGDVDGAGPGAEPPFFLKYRDDNKNLEVGFWNDNTGSIEAFQSGFALNAGEWYSAALTYDGTTAKMYLKGESDADYVLANSILASGGNLASAAGTWTVGRGMWNNGLADWFDGSIDEVRISDTALAPSAFIAIPEPATLGLVALMGGGMLFIRKKFMI